MPELAITKDTPTREATILGQRVQVHTPYTEGYSLNAHEAAVLNQTRIENIRNNCNKDVQEAIDAAGGPEKVDKRIVQKIITDYSLIYKFGERKGGGFRALDPVEKEAMTIARDLVNKALVKKGIRVSDVSAAEKTKLASKALESKKGAAIWERARKTVAARQEAAAELEIEV